MATVQDQQHDVGASVVHIFRSSGGNWLVAPRSALNRRITADSLPTSTSVVPLPRLHGTVAGYADGVLTVQFCGEDGPEWRPAG